MDLGVLAGARVGAGPGADVGVGCGVLVGSGDGVAVCIGVSFGSGVGVWVGVGVSVGSGVGVVVGVGVGRSDTPAGSISIDILLITMPPIKKVTLCVPGANSRANTKDASSPGSKPVMMWINSGSPPSIAIWNGTDASLSNPWMFFSITEKSTTTKSWLAVTESILRLWTMYEIGVAVGAGVLIAVGSGVGV